MSSDISKRQRYSGFEGKYEFVMSLENQLIFLSLFYKVSGKN